MKFEKWGRGGNGSKVGAPIQAPLDTTGPKGL